MTMTAPSRRVRPRAAGDQRPPAPDAAARGWLATQTDRLLPAHPAVGYLAHLQRYGPVPPVRVSQLVEQTSAVALTGRGGAGFPLSRKLIALADASRPVLVLNWCEGDPTSAKDEALAMNSPHLVVDGLILLAAATRAHRVIVAVRSGSRIERAATQALTERPDAAPCEVLRVPDQFVASEASAIVSLIQGSGSRPLGRLAPIWQRGVDQRPTTVLNAESAAQLRMLTLLGPNGFAAVGDPAEPGTALVTVGGPVARPGVFEVPTGTRMAQVLDAAGAAATGWALTGGLAGQWVEVAALRSARFTTVDFDRIGATRGVGSIVLLGAGCVLTETAGIAQYLANESAGQCGPCMFGLPAIAADLAALRDGDVGALQRLSRRLPTVDGRGACAHPDGTVRLVASALRALNADRHHLQHHLQVGLCGAPALRLGVHR